MGLGMSKIKAAAAVECVAATVECVAATAEWFRAAVGFRAEVRIRTKWKRFVVLSNSLYSINGR